MRTKAVLGAIIVAVLAVFGVVGLQQNQRTEAGAIFGVSGCSGTTVVIGNSCDFTVTFFDDNGTTAVAVNNNFGAVTVGTLAHVSTTCQNATIFNQSFAGPANQITLFDAGANNPALPAGVQPIAANAVYTNGSGWNVNPGSGCDANITAEMYTWTLRFTCTTEGNVGLNVWGPATFAGATNANFGSVVPGINGGVGGGFTGPIILVQCVASNLAGFNGGTVTIRKVDQFGQPLLASFSIQQGPFWVEVARVNLGATLAQNPCATDGTQGTFNITGAGTSCANVGVISPAVFASGLPAGQYRIVEVAGPNSYCTLVQVYNGNQGQNQSGVLPFSGSLLTQPVTVNLPTANPLDVQLTFVNSCIVPGGASTATSQIAVVIGGSTPGLVNTSNIEIVPAPGSDDDARLDIRIRDSASIVIPNAHVTVLIDKGALALRRDLSGVTPASGYDVIEPAPATANFASPFSGDTCDQSTNGWWQQSTSTGGYTWPFLSSSRQQADGYTNSEGVISACVYVDTTLAPGTTPGKINIQAIVETPGQGGLYNSGGVVNNVNGINPYYPLGNNLSLPNYFGVPNIVLTASITVVGPPASITVAAAPTSLNCGEKATITVTVKDSAGQNVSDRTRVELVTNFGGVIGGTTATLGPVSVAGGNVYPVSSSSAETFNGVATAYLLTSTDHVGPYEVVAAAGGSVMASNGYLAPWYTTGATTANNLTPNISAYFPWYNQGLLTYSPSSAPVNAQATVTCSVPGAPAAAAPAPVVTAPRTGQGPADAFAIRPPNTGDAGLKVSGMLKGISW